MNYFTYPYTTVYSAQCYAPYKITCFIEVRCRVLKHLLAVGTAQAVIIGIGSSNLVVASTMVLRLIINLRLRITYRDRERVRTRKNEIVKEV